MTVSAQVPQNEYTANGVTRIFPFTFKILYAADLKVYLNDVLTATGFEISGIGENNGGNITFITDDPPTNGTIIKLVRNTSFTRDYDYITSGTLDANTLDSDIDRVVMMIQDIDNNSLTTNDIGQIDANNHKIINVSEPTSLTDAATKNYVDTVLTSSGNMPAAANPADNGKFLYATAGVASWQAPQTLFGYIPANTHSPTFDGTTIFNGDAAVLSSYTLKTDNLASTSNTTITVVNDIYAGDVNVTFSNLTFENNASPTYPTSPLSINITQTKKRGIPTFDALTTAFSGSQTKHFRYGLQGRLDTASMAWFQPQGNSTTIDSIGFGYTTKGTVTARTCSTGIVQRQRRVGFVSAATTGSFAGFYGNGNTWCPKEAFTFSCTFAPSSAGALSSHKAFYGMSSNTSSPTNVEPSTLINAVGICKDSGDTTFKFIWNGTSAGTNSITMPAAFDPDSLSTKIYKLFFTLYYDTVVYCQGSFEVYDGSSNEPLWTYYLNVNGGTADIPGPDVFLSPRLWRMTPSNTAIGLDVMNMTIENHGDFVA